MAQDTQLPLHRLRIRFFRNEGLEKWRVFEIAATLPQLLQIALLLFFVGLSEFLRELNPAVGWTVTSLMGTWLSIYTFTLLAPMFSSQCPYKTPILKKPLDNIRPILQGIWDPFVGHAIRLSRFFLYVPEAAVGLLRWIFKTLRTPIACSKLTSIKKIFGETRTLLKDWACERFPEEHIIQKMDDSDITILICSEPLFHDKQLTQIIGECTHDIKLSDFYRYHLNSRGPPRASSISTKRNSWIVSLPAETGNRVRNIAKTILLCKTKNSEVDDTWPEVLECILTDWKNGPWWDHLPDIFIRLVESSAESGALQVFQALRSSANHKDFHPWNMCHSCHLGKATSMKCLYYRQ